MSASAEVYRNAILVPITGPHTITHPGGREEIIPGIHPDPLTFKLKAQQVAIRVVVVDNPKPLGLEVVIFGGPSPSGPPLYVVTPGRSARVSVEGPSSVHIKFVSLGKDGRPAASGYVYIAITTDLGDDYFSAESVNVGTMPSVDIGTMPDVVIKSIPEHDVRITHSVPLDIHSMPPVNVSTEPSWPPSGAVRVIRHKSVYSVTSATAATRIEIDAGPLAPQHTLYVVAIILKGFSFQPFLEWRFQIRNNQGAYDFFYRGYGDEEAIFPQPYLQARGATAAQGLWFDIVNAHSVLGTFKGHLYVMGYYKNEPAEELAPMPVA